jgi:hypothetical protein
VREHAPFLICSSLDFLLDNEPGENFRNYARKIIGRCHSYTVNREPRRKQNGRRRNNTHEILFKEERVSKFKVVGGQTKNELSGKESEMCG